MNMGRYALTVVAVWVVRVIFGWLFWGNYMTEKYAAATAAWSDAFRVVVPAYIVADLLFAAVFVWLWVKVGSTFGGDLKGGALYGLVVGLLASVIPSIYLVYSFTYISTSMWATEIVAMLVLYVAIGIVAALVYKATPAAA
jgi:hypothetical protein